MEDSPRIVVMGLLCGNVGLTLTSPRYPIDVLVADLDWSPSQIGQAIKRVYRPSQKYPVTAYTVLTNRSMDMDMLDLVYRKSKGIAQALDKVNPDDVERPTPMSQREMLDELARRIEARQAGEARMRAEVLVQQGRTEDAVRILGAALGLPGLSPEVWGNLYRFTEEVIHKAMEGDPARSLRYQADLKALEDIARQRQPVEQAELLRAA